MVNFLADRLATIDYLFHDRVDRGMLGKRSFQQSGGAMSCIPPHQLHLWAASRQVAERLAAVSLHSLHSCFRKLFCRRLGAKQAINTIACAQIGLGGSKFQTQSPLASSLSRAMEEARRRNSEFLAIAASETNS